MATPWVMPRSVTTADPHASGDLHHAVGSSAQALSRWAAQALTRWPSEVFPSWALGWKLGSGAFRLIRYRVRRALPRHLLWLGLFAAATALSSAISGCQDPARSGEQAPSSSALLPLPPELAKLKKGAAKQRNTPWDYVLPVDHGVRSDASGDGYFRAPRQHGEHNGIDLLAPVGTPTFAACTGKAMSDRSPSFGRWVQVVCPVPGELAPPRGVTPWVSFFYAHLDESTLPTGSWVNISRGSQVGTVGKTGNARGPLVQPHLHLELIVQEDQKKAMAERHFGTDQARVAAAQFFADKMSETCLDPFGFRPKRADWMRARRVDPFVALVCLGDAKPNFERAKAPLDLASSEWSQFYSAKGFNVDRGPQTLRF